MSKFLGLQPRTWLNAVFAVGVVFIAYTVSVAVVISIAAAPEYAYATAELQAPATDTSAVSFGTRVTVERDDGRVQKFRIVGEDEANPSKGSISYVSPLAQALMGKAVGDVVKAGGGEAEIIKIE